MFSKVKELFQKYNYKYYQFSLLLLVVVLSLFGVFMVGSAAPALFDRQLMGLFLGVTAMIVISFVDYKLILKFTLPLYGVNLVLLGAVLIFGEEINGARRWLALGDFLTFQPSDLTKIILILFFAKFFARQKASISKFRVIIPAVILLLPSVELIRRQPNLSNTIVLILVFLVLLFLAGVSYKLIGAAIAVAVPMVAALFVVAMQPDQQILMNFQQDRILAFLNPEDFAQEAAYQQLNSVMAIGSGQLTGRGFNSVDPTTLKNSGFIPEAQNDFIFSIIGEELGFVGCSMVIILLLLIILLCILTGMRSGDMAGRLICGGVATLIAIQGFINIGVATKIIPNTGVSLPFVSYGLTSLVSLCIGVGLVLNVGLHPRKHLNNYMDDEEN